MFEPEEEKQIILQWVYSIYKRLGGMSVDEIYQYLLGQNKDSFVQELDSVLSAHDSAKAEEEVVIADFRKNIKELQKKISKLGE